MEAYTLHTLESASGRRKDALKRAKDNFGFIPNLIGLLAESPPVVEAYIDITSRLNQTTLTPQEQQVVYLVLSRENACGYCIAAHTGGAKGAKVPDSVIEAIRNKKPIPDARLAALARFAEQALTERGHVDPEEMELFIKSGYTKANVLDVLLAIAAKVITTYADPIVDAKIDEAFKPFI
jgi:AhpD family alkylhydroperoxidase